MVCDTMGWISMQELLFPEYIARTYYRTESRFSDIIRWYVERYGANPDMCSGVVVQPDSLFFMVAPFESV